MDFKQAPNSLIRETFEHCWRNVFYGLDAFKMPSSQSQSTEAENTCH